MTEFIERNIIVNKSQLRPYGVRISFKTWTLGTLGNLEKVTILNKTGLIIKIASTEKAPWEGGRPIKIEVDGFASATQAELSGKQLTMVLLWHAIKNGHALMLTYQTPEPAYVYERNRSSGFGMSGYGDVSVNQSEFIEALSEDYSKVPCSDPKLLLSMEIFAASGLETSERAKFLSMVNALEVLPSRKKQNNEINNFVKHIQNLLKKNEDIDEETKHTLSSSIGNLKNESITQSLKRYVSEILPEKQGIEEIIDAAYTIRSKIVHEGKPKDSGKTINEIMAELEDVMRSIYSKKIKINC